MLTTRDMNNNFGQQTEQDWPELLQGDDENDYEVVLDSSPSHDSSSMQLDQISYQSANEEQGSSIFDRDILDLLNDPYHKQFIDCLTYYREHPKEFADLNVKKTAASIKSMLDWLNKPEVDRILLYFGYEEYDNELEYGIYIQQASKEFKRQAPHNFDEANFPFKDQGGPQKKKLQEFGYIYKYWVGKQDPSYKLRKFYLESGLAIFVVFRDESTNSSTYSPGSSSDDTIKQEVTPPPNKKRRREDSDQDGFNNNSSKISNGVNIEQYGDNNTVNMSCNQTTNINPNAATIINTQQMIQNNVYHPNNNYSAQQSIYNQHNTMTNTGINANVRSSSVDPHLEPQQGNNTNKSNNTQPNSLNNTLEDFSNQLSSLSISVDGLNKRMLNLETSATNHVQTKTRSLDEKQRQLCRLIIKVLRDNGNRFKKGKPLASQIRPLVGGKLETKAVNNLLYTVLEAIGIIQLQDEEWVLIDEEKAKQFEE